MRPKSGPRDTALRTVKDIRRATRKQYSAEEKIRIVREGLRGEYVDYAAAESFMEARVAAIATRAAGGDARASVVQALRRSNSHPRTPYCVAANPGS